MGDGKLKGAGDRRWDGRDTRVGGIFRDSSSGRRVSVKCVERDRRWLDNLNDVSFVGVYEDEGRTYMLSGAV